MSNCTSCNSNTLFISTPTQQMAQNCSNDTCGQGLNTGYTAFNSPISFCSGGKLGKRPNREAVREQIKMYVLAKMGAPVVKIEASEQQLDIAIDFALQVFEDYCGRRIF